MNGRGGYGGQAATIQECRDPKLPMTRIYHARRHYIFPIGLLLERASASIRFWLHGALPSGAEDLTNGKSIQIGILGAHGLDESRNHSWAWVQE